MPARQAVVKIEPRQDGWVAILACGHEVELDDRGRRDLPRQKYVIACSKCPPGQEAA